MLTQINILYKKMTNTHIRPILFGLLTVILTLIPFPANAAFKDYSAVMENLNRKLSSGCSAEDSIKVLTNMVDITLIRPVLYKPDSIIRLTYDVAVNNKDYATAYEMLRTRANLFSTHIDSLNRFLEYAKDLPPHPQKAETITFIEMKRNSFFTFYEENESSDKRIDELLRKLIINQPEDIYEQIYLLHAICLHLYRDSNGELMVKYYEDLNQLLDKLPSDCYSLRNLAAVESAIAYSLAGKKEKSIEADKNLLQIINNLKTHYNAIGRPYRNYGANKYVIYTRMLSNWEKLTPDEIEEYYNLAMKFKDEDVRAYNTYNQLPQPSIFYAAAKKDYKKLYELTKELSYSDLSGVRKHDILRYMMMAAESEGDVDMMLKTSKAYINVLEKRSQPTNHDRELQVLYETYKMREQMASTEIERQDEVNSLQHSIIVICGIALIGLIIMVICLIRLYRHSRKLTNTLFESNEALKSESCALRASQREVSNARDAAEKANEFKSDFIQNLSHEISSPLSTIVEYSRLLVDCTDAAKKPYLEKYAKMITDNTEFLNSVINDVFHLSEIDSDSVTLHRKLVDIRKVIDVSVGIVSSSLKPGVVIEIESETPNIDTFTDPNRVNQILNHVLENAVRYTEKGRILIAYDYVNNGKEIAISVTDNGPGIASKYKEHIFERFVKLNPKDEGIGLGLPISKLLAKLLGGDLVLDTTYSHGARFILTLPYAMK